MFDELLEVGHDQKGFPGRDTNAPLEETWDLQIGQLQKIFYITPNMSNENLRSYSLASGLFDELLEVGHDQKGSDGRDTNDPSEESWNLQIGQLQKTIYKLQNMSNERLNQFSLTSGLFDELLEVGHDQKGAPGRSMNAPALGPWNLQIGQSRGTFYTEPNMSYAQ